MAQLENLISVFISPFLFHPRPLEISLTFYFNWKFIIIFFCFELIERAYLRSVNLEFFNVATTIVIAESYKNFFS